MKRRAKPARTDATATARDVLVLESIGFARYLSTGQVARLHFAGRKRVAQRRLRALLDLGLVRAQLQEYSLHKDTLFALSAHGARFLVERGVEEHLARAARIPNPRALPHSLLVRDVLVQFELASVRGDLELHDFLLEGELARTEAFAAAHIVPDGLAIVTPGGVRSPTPRRAERRVALEVDLGHEPLRVLRDKLTRYDALVRAVVVTEIVFVVTGERRGLSAAIRELGLDRIVRLVDASVLRDVVSPHTQPPPALAPRVVRRVEATGGTEIVAHPAEEAVGFRGVRPVLRRRGEGSPLLPPQGDG